MKGRQMSSGLGKEGLPLAVCEGFGHWEAPQLP